MVLTADGITRMEAVAAQRRLASLFNNNLKREYSEMCSFIRARMSLAIMRSNTFLLHDTRDTEMYISQRQDLEDG